MNRTGREGHLKDSQSLSVAGACVWEVVTDGEAGEIRKNQKMQRGGNKRL